MKNKDKKMIFVMIRSPCRGILEQGNAKIKDTRMKDGISLRIQPANVPEKNTWPPE